MFAKDFRRKAWESLKGNWGLMIGICVVYDLILVGVQLIPGVGTIASLLIGGPLMLGLYMAFIKLIRKEKVELGELFSGFKNNFIDGFLLALLNGLFIFLWSLLFIIPGIVKTYSYAMSYYILAENPQLSQAEARKASIEMMKGNRFRLFCLELSFIGWMILSVFTFGILLFWVAPYMQAARAAFYEDLKTRSKVVVEAKTEAEATVEATPAYDPEIK